MKKNDELRNDFNIDPETADRVAKEYPSLSESAKERMFNMTKEKMNNTENDHIEDENSVQGVELYDRPRWIKFAGMAAAVLLIAGGIGGGSYLLRNMKSTAPAPGSSAVEEVTTHTTGTVTTAAVTAETTTGTNEKVTGTATENTTATITTTAAAAETTAAQTEEDLHIQKEAAHKLTDNYWDYECLFGNAVSTRADFEQSIKCKYEIQEGASSNTFELEYYRSVNKELVGRNMEELKEYYYTYFTDNYDPFYDPRSPYTEQHALFGPSFTGDADLVLDNYYSFIEYNGEIYQIALYKSFDDSNHWTDDQTDISNVTEKSFTLKRKFRNDSNAMFGDTRGEVTFDIVFDESAQDWRIDKTEKNIQYS